MNVIILDSIVQGHKARLVFGILNDKPVVCMQGRFHGYEGYSSSAVRFIIDHNILANNNH